ncbi:hypothetical protein ACA910_022628 [Epithemia clementina (nom. ined.)]
MAAATAITTKLNITASPHHHRVLFDDSVFEHGGPETPDDKKNASSSKLPVDYIAATETKYLTISKAIVISSIVLAAALVSTGAYIFLKQEEDDGYTTSYYHLTNSAKETNEMHRSNTFGAARSLSQTLTAQAQALNLTFPLVTFASFETLCHGVRSQAPGGVDTIFYNPILPDTSGLTTWNDYSVQHQSWIQASRLEAAALSTLSSSSSSSSASSSTMPDAVYFGLPPRDIPIQKAPEYGSNGPFMPLWMQSPPPSDPSFLNFDLYKPHQITLDAVLQAKGQAILSEFLQDESSILLLAEQQQQSEDGEEPLISATAADDPQQQPQQQDVAHPRTTLHIPVLEQLNDASSRMVGILSLTLSWNRYALHLLPDGMADGIMCVLKNTCGQAYTYKLDGNSTQFVGQGDFHDPNYDDTEVVLPFHDFVDSNNITLLDDIPGHCMYSFHFYSSAEFEERYRSNLGIALSITVACTFFFMIGTFFFYDYFVKRRNSKVLDMATRTSAIVSSLFPSNVRDRLLLLGDANNDTKGKKGDPSNNNKKEAEGGHGGTRSKLKHFLLSEVELESCGGDAETKDLEPYGSKPIADIFPETTILFADIVGFTAWSSTREPSQVFTLLETIYKAFDDIATRRRVFKVETVGDCYVAVCGLPDPRVDHAVVMARFARACMRKMQELVHKLELSLGPDTADLSMRMGLHSGPVTAGVLRGERARFQLFGDTMNTASRMESLGEKGMIQCSQETADLLLAAGKGNWFRPRQDKIHAKGKGQLQTYWLATDFNNNNQVGSGSQLPEGATVPVPLHAAAPGHVLDKSERLVKWNCDLLMKSLLEIECARVSAAEQSTTTAPVPPSPEQFPQSNPAYDMDSSRHETVLEEVQEIIRLPQFNGGATKTKPSDVQLPPIVAEQLHSYIGAVAMLYRDNPFHCFEHASHVTMSVSKLMSRIIAPELSSHDVSLHLNGNKSMESALHDHTYGITSDPLVQFACVFSALIHDVDHTGVPNTQLARENPPLAAMYRGRSIAEQNSVDLAWNLLMETEYEQFRHAIYQTPAEKARFRQLVVNSVMATDIMDKELKQLRNLRWERAFSSSSSSLSLASSSNHSRSALTKTAALEESIKDAVDRKATIVIEHLIQASDVAHTMQHWHVYRKWNSKLYAELYSAFVSGRGDRDPAEFWYQGELGFFDFYIIPLARKLKDCGVFGVSSDEYLNYALKNRAEWEERGREVVAELVQEMKKLYPPSSCTKPVSVLEAAKPESECSMSSSSSSSLLVLKEGEAEVRSGASGKVRLEQTYQTPEQALI